MKVVRVDNFNRDCKSDVVVAENVSNYYGTKIVKFLNSGERPDSEDFYVLKENEEPIHIADY